MTFPHLAQRLYESLGLHHQPVAVTFHDGQLSADDPVGTEPAGCCFWEPAQHRRLVTAASDHAGCSVGSYVHGLIPLSRAADVEDVAALIACDWVTPADLAAVPRLPWTPGSIVYQPLRDARRADVVLLRLDPHAVMTLQGAVPDLALVAKPQCQIVALAAAGHTVISPGCALSRVRTGLPPGELTAALPGDRLPGVLAALTQTAAADQKVARYAAATLTTPRAAVQSTHLPNP